MNENIITTFKKLCFKNCSVLRMSITIEGVGFIFLENLQNNHKDMLFNSKDLKEVEKKFEELKNNSIINGESKYEK